MTGWQGTEQAGARVGTAAQGRARAGMRPSTARLGDSWVFSAVLKGVGLTPKRGLNMSETLSNKTQCVAEYLRV